MRWELDCSYVIKGFSSKLNKNRINQEKHGVSFELTELVFDNSRALSRQDRFENGEMRWQTIGMVGESLLILLVAHTVEDEGESNGDGGEQTRIMPARRATPVERKIYEQGS